MAEGDTDLCYGADGMFYCTGIHTSSLLEEFCEMCIDDERPSVEARGSCVECGKYLCTSCYTGHQKTRVTRHSVLQDNTSMPKDIPLSGSSTPKDNITATKLADIDVTSVDDEKRCWIIGSAAMNANTLLIADANNNKLKLINTDTNTVTAALDFPEGPWDVAAINQHQAVATVPGSKKIPVVQVTDTLVKEREINLSENCLGVSYNQERLFVTYADGKPRLEILDLHGTVIRTIDKDSDGRKLFQCPQYVCVSKDGETVYVSDDGRHTVTSLSLDGVVKAVYKDEDLCFPTQVCTDHHGHVYVCGLGGANVHILTADCRKVKVILTLADGLESFVWSVSHCQDPNRLFIGMENNAIKSYQLS